MRRGLPSRGGTRAPRLASSVAAVLALSRPTWALGSPTQGLNPSPLRWKDSLDHQGGPLDSNIDIIRLCVC